VTPLLRILAFAGAVNLLAFVAYWVFLSRNLTGQLLRFSLVTFVARVVFILVGVHWGVIGVAVGYAATPAISAPVSIWWLSRMAPIPLRELLGGYAGPPHGAGRDRRRFGVVTLLGDVTPVLSIAAASARRRRYVPAVGRRPAADPPGPGRGPGDRAAGSAAGSAQGRVKSG
jgi:hypothetical protein